MSKKKRQRQRQKVIPLGCKPGEHVWARSVPFGFHRVCMECSAWWSLVVSFKPGVREAAQDGEWYPVGKMDKDNSPEDLGWILEEEKEVEDDAPPF